jgi:hypothetical protein
MASMRLRPIKSILAAMRWHSLGRTFDVGRAVRIEVINERHNTIPFVLA